MNSNVRSRTASRRRGRLLLILCLGLTLLPIASGFPSATEAQGSRFTVSQAVSLELQPGLTLKALPSPQSLQDFTALTINRLSAAAPFTEWKNAKTEFYPLGPGTHSWLVNVKNGEQRIGYLIVSATEDGGYLLSEYGAGTSGLPYSMTELRQFLVQEELIPSSYSGKAELTALYAPMLPVWKLTLDKQTYYINALTLEILPWSLSKAESVLNGTLPAAGTVTSVEHSWTPQRAFRSGGQDDPYADLQWLASPKLKLVNGDNVAVLLGSGSALAFQSAGKNDTTGAPFMITGYQSWQISAQGTPNQAKTVIYAASGLQGRRYLPLTALQQTGTLHKLPQSQNIASGTIVQAADFMLK
ncbi:hypothetical protein [Paenibacillus ihuae]|uniref:hypothetical protein n=1 Tax=Paenibacillus ihuae TaxID=1232431 RepID=UPI0006D5324A|nr:hypothetical protein [Paenibacillus ihuae]